MKSIFKIILSSTLFLSTTPASDMSEKAGMEEVKKKKKKKGKKIEKGGKKKKKGFFSKVFGSK
tara:strand:+ start:319 stop:507 length:189 start_codon:yes stop_codon:yes gene_type:complete